MSEQTNAELIEVAREFTDPDVGYAYKSDWDHGQANPLIARLASALEAAEQRADRMDAAAERHNSIASDIAEEAWELEDQRDAALAVIEKVRLETEELRTQGYPVGVLLRILATAPADALREVKANAIREYVEAARENPHTLYWPPSGVLDDAEQWAEEIEKGTI
ncbi:MAG: hypothetical protein ACTH32_06410 [Microbacterium gubbeenense]|uniref:hypothetical protein n=1 Tax=Microbacterium gubbeenense TaxID=159896 RepID=UPI003F9B3BA3